MILLRSVEQVGIFSEISRIWTMNKNWTAFYKTSKVFKILQVSPIIHPSGILRNLNAYALLIYVYIYVFIWFWTFHTTRKLVFVYILKRIMVWQKVLVDFLTFHTLQVSPIMHHSGILQNLNAYALLIYVHIYVFICNFSETFRHMKWAVTHDFQQCGILTSVNSDEPL